MSAYSYLRQGFKMFGSDRRLKSGSFAKNQRGIALIVVLLVTAIVTIIVVESRWRFELTFSRASNRMASQQTYSYGYGIEDAAKVILRYDITGGDQNKDANGQQSGFGQNSGGNADNSDRDSDAADTSKADTLDDIWAEEITLPTDEGYVKINIVDAFSKFNLNALSIKTRTKNQTAFEKRFSAQQRLFIRLLQAIPLNDDDATEAQAQDEQEYLDLETATSITEAITDWIDSDNEVTGFGGAENDYYAGLEPPIVAANRPFISVSELLIIQGMTPKLYEKLLSYVTVLPDNTTIFNVNTVPLEMFRAINAPKESGPLSIEEAEFLAEEQSSGWEDINEFRASSGFESTFPALSDGKANADTDGLTTASSFFEVNGEVGIGDKIKRTKSLLVRDREQISVLRRSDSLL